MLRVTRFTSDSEIWAAVHSPSSRYHFGTQLIAPSSANTASFGLQGAMLPSSTPSLTSLRKQRAASRKIELRLSSARSERLGSALPHAGTATPWSGRLPSPLERRRFALRGPDRACMSPYSIVMLRDSQYL